MMQIKIFDDASLKGYSFIEGFPGAGLVGPMAASYMIEKLKMKYIGYMQSDLFPPIAAVHSGVPMPTVRLYADRSNKIVVILSEFTIPQNAIYQMSEELLSFVRKCGMSKIISIGGMPSPKQSGTAFVIASDAEVAKKAAKQGMNPIKEGVIAGVSALLVTGAKELKIPTVNLLVEVNPVIMDPKYAETAIGALNKLTGLEIDLSELKKEAKEVESRVREIMKKAKDSHEHLNKTDEEGVTGPPSYA
jgi:uncharacterized protein